MAHPLAVFGALTLAHYLLVYTLWLAAERMDTVGAFAGAAPPLLADAVDGSIGGTGLLLFAIVSGSRRTWAIASWRADDFAAGGFPMLPAVLGRPSRGVVARVRDRAIGVT